jgi:hypothetical protein
MNKETNTEETIAYEKAVAVIESCVTEEHFKNAAMYLHNFYVTFDNEERYKDLIEMIGVKRIKL